MSVSCTPSELARSARCFCFGKKLANAVTTFLMSKWAGCTSTATITTSGSWTAPAGITLITVECWGGGGGGGGSATGAQAQGAGGGEYCKSSIPVIPGNVYAVIVGAAGIGQLKAQGTDGGDSYFDLGLDVRAKGGGGGNVDGGLFHGIGGNGGMFNMAENVGGNGFANVLAPNGGGGGAGFSGAGGNAVGPTGGIGVAPHGGNGGTSANVINPPGCAGNNYGGGGSANNVETGCDGAPGLVIITW